MTAIEFLELGMSATVASSAWVLFVLTVRKPVARYLGSRWAYYLWLVPLIALLTTAIPHRNELSLNLLLWPDLPTVNETVADVIMTIGQLTGRNEASRAITAGAIPLQAANLVLAIWLLGLLLALSILALQWRRFSLALHAGQSAPTGEQLSQLRRHLPARGSTAEVRFISLQYGPAVSGVFHPVLVLPDHFFRNYLVSLNDTPQ
jgi:beta-lactamase regulating signal transducer with metallopeptidase domain